MSKLRQTRLSCFSLDYDFVSHAAPLRPPPHSTASTVLLGAVAQMMSRGACATATFAAMALVGPSAASGVATCDHSYDCGYPGITEVQCEARGCCFDHDPKPLQCSGFLRNCTSAADCNNHGTCVAGACSCDAGFAGAYCNQTQPPPYPQIKTVHVINRCGQSAPRGGGGGGGGRVWFSIVPFFHTVALRLLAKSWSFACGSCSSCLFSQMVEFSCHLDIGFADSSAGIINEYFTTHLPTAVAVGTEMEKGVAGCASEPLACCVRMSHSSSCPPPAIVRWVPPQLVGSTTAMTAGILASRRCSAKRVAASGNYQTQAVHVHVSGVCVRCPRACVSALTRARVCAARGAWCRARVGPRYTDSKLNFMFQSWVLDLFFDCPPNMGLQCPDAAAQAAVRDAIARDHITWHAFPHNAQLEVMDPALIAAGLELTFALDKAFNKTNKTTLSQRDVPGMTRALMPILNRRGITAVSIGANDGSTPPDLPPCFRWVDAPNASAAGAGTGSNSSVVGLFNWPGCASFAAACYVPSSLSFETWPAKSNCSRACPVFTHIRRATAAPSVWLGVSLPLPFVATVALFCRPVIAWARARSVFNVQLCCSLRCFGEFVGRPEPPDCLRSRHIPICGVFLSR